MDMAATSRKRPASSPFNAKARQPICSVGSIPLPRTCPSPPTDNEAMLYRKGGCNRERNCRIPCISPSAFCTKAKGGGGVFVGRYGNTRCTHGEGNPCLRKAYTHSRGQRQSSRHGWQCAFDVAEWSWNEAREKDGLGTRLGRRMVWEQG